ncbi:MAG: nucleoside hydrolase [Acidimicrobiia bacterium]|nr:nucleoside hydrolase [Acidimicrobiia bacterium]
MTPRPIVIDTDPGQDDAVAILLALASPEDLDVVAITAVAGNVPLDRSESNARRIVELAGRTDVPVYRGMARPLVRESGTAEAVHGSTGLDGADLPPPTMPLTPGHGVDAIVDILRSRDPGTVTLCPLGPLTDVAAAMTRAPDVVGRIREIVLMGGGFFEGGNWTPAAEFNIWVDPHAADVVFRSGVPITMVPIDVTHKALIEPRHLDRLRALGTPVGDAVAGMLDFFNRYDMARYGTVGAPLHDPCVIAWLLEPDLFTGKDCSVRIETMSELTMGMTVVDWWGLTDDPPNARVIHDVDAEGFFDLVIERLARL